MKLDLKLMFRFFRDKHTPQEAEKLGSWLEEDPAHQDVFRQAFQVFQAESILMEARKKKSVRLLRWAGAAAAAAAVFAAGFFFNKEIDGRQNLEHLEYLTNQVAIQETLPGDRVRITLPDKSIVYLNAESRLEYFSVYDGGERRVKLCGEAMFEVHADASHPFIVETPTYNVVATGTRFNVLSSVSREEFSTTLLKGTVQVANHNGEDLLHLVPGQEAILDQGSLVVRTAEDAEDSVLWTRGLISVSGVPFDKLMKTFERCFGVKIVIDRPDIPTVHYGLAKVRISNGVEYALSMLKKRSNFNYRYDEGTQTYHIY